MKKKNVKRTIFGLITTALLTAALGATAMAEPGNTIPAEGNLLKNGGGETGDISNWKHDYTGFDTLYEAQEDSDFFSYTPGSVKPNSGKYSIISDPFYVCYKDFQWQLSPFLNLPEGGDQTSTVELYQDVDVSGLSAGTELILRGYVTSEGNIKATFLDASDTKLVEYAAKDRTVKNDNGWKYQRAAFKIPANAKTCRVSLVAAFHRYVGGYGDPYGEYTRGGFDDVSLTVRKAPSYTATKAPAEGECLKNGGGESGNLDGWFYEYEDFVVFHPVTKTDFFSYTNVTPKSGSYCIASDFFWANSDHNYDSGGSFYLADNLPFDNEDDNTSAVVIYQQVDLSAVAQGSSLVLDGYVGGQGDIALVVYDSQDKVLVSKTAANTGETQSGWRRQTATVTVPAGAAWARVFLNAAYERYYGAGVPSGEYTRGAFDDISLKAVKAGSGQQAGGSSSQGQDGKEQTTTATAKAANPMTIKVAKKTFSRSKQLKKKKTFSIGVKKAKGKVTYTLSKKAKKAGIKVTAKGKVTVPKKCKKGTYTITVTAKGTDAYKSVKKTVKIIVKDSGSQPR